MNTNDEISGFKPSGNPAKTRVGIGMPATLYLQEFGVVVYDAFGEMPYHCGSSLLGATWRDVDVRLMLDPEVYAAMGLGDPKMPHENPRWCALVKAFSLLGQKMTGLPIDFQIQERDTANREHTGPRSALLVGIIRRQSRESANPE